MKPKLFLIFSMQIIWLTSFGQISFTESGSSIVIINYGVTASYQKESVSTLLNNQYFEVKSNDKTVLIVKDYTLVTSPISSSLSDLQSKVSILLNVPSATLTESSVSTLTNKTMSGSNNTFTNIPYASLTGTPTIPTSSDYVDRTNGQSIAGLKQFNGSFAASGSLARGFYISPTLAAVANNDFLVGLDIVPTFTPGAFTGVVSVGLRHTGDILPSVNATYNLGSATLKYANVLTGVVNGGTSTLTLRTNSINSIQLATSGRVLVQNGGTFTDDTVNQLQVGGSVKSTQYRLSALNAVPASATDTGTLGEIRITSGAVYVCTATNVWVRALLTTF